MGWLGPDGPAPITGARWSAGAFWADASDPQASDSDWEDPDDWPLTYDDSGVPLTLRVFIGGWDATSWMQSASFGNGQDGLFSALSVGSASLALLSTLAEMGDYPYPLDVAQRIVITTEHDVLWSGLSETVTEDDSPGQPSPLISITAVDDLSRATAVAFRGGIGGDLPAEVIKRLFALTNLPKAVGFIGIGFVGQTPIPMGTTRDSDVMAVISEIAESRNWALALRRDGLRMWVRRMTATLPFVNPYPDFLVGASRVSRSANVTEVWNTWTYTREGLPVEFIDHDSVRKYGPRAHAPLDFGDLLPGQFTDYLSWEQAFPRLAQPSPAISADFLIGDSADVIHRAEPLDRGTDGGDRYLFKTVKHQIDVTEWRVSLSAVYVVAP